MKKIIKNIIDYLQKSTNPPLSRHAEGLTYWREKTAYIIHYIIIVILSVFLIPTSVYLYYINMWQIAVLAAIIFIWALIVVGFKVYYKTAMIVDIILLYAYAIISLNNYGLAPIGLVMFFGAPIGIAIFLSLRAVIIAIFINIIIFSLLLFVFNIHTVAVKLNLNEWMFFFSYFITWDILFSITIVMLIYALNKMHKAEKNKSLALIEERSELIKLNSNLNNRMEEVKIAESAVKQSENKYKNLYENAFVGMITHKFTTGEIISINYTACRIFGFSSKTEVVNKTRIQDFLAEAGFQKEGAIKLIKNKQIAETEVKFKKIDGTIIWCLLTSRYYPDQDKVEAIVSDISVRKQTESQLHSLKYFDQLTQLPNKNSFITSIENEILKSKNRMNKTRFALLYLSIERFKEINNIYGEQSGDDLLIQISKRLRDVIFKKDTVARFDGAKFMILFSDIAHKDDTGEIIKKIDNTFKEPFAVYRDEIKVNINIGISLYPDDGDDPNALIKSCDVARYIAKEKRTFVHFSDDQMNMEMLQRFELEKELQNAIKNDEFVAYYQPKVTKDGKLIGIEALIRWQSPTKGLIAPMQFIPLAERNGMIIDIGKIILRKSCEQNKKWQDYGFCPKRLSVNISPYQFHQPDLLGDIQNILFDTGLAPEWLELELTESGIMENEKASIQRLLEIHKMGISISIDDFGTGYSSLSKLKLYPIDTLKIDKSFVDDLPDNAMSVNIATAIIDLAHNLGFKVVAEGVETKPQLDFLIDRNCDQFQGYYYSKPLSPEDFEIKYKINKMNVKLGL